MPEKKLHKVLDVYFGLAIVVGGTIGVGILRTPGIVAANLHNSWAILGIWILGGLYALCGANSLAELATMLPKAGGPYVYIRRSLGEFAGFAGGMNDFILNCCGAAYVAVTFGEYLGQLFARAQGHENFIAVIVLSLLFLLNLAGVRSGEVTQKIVSVVKVVAFMILIGACFVFGHHAGGVPPVRDAMFVSGGVIAAMALSSQAVMETYAGWNSAVYFSEENTNPSRGIPRALFVGVAIVCGVFVLVNAALLYALPVSVIASSKLPAADAARQILGESGATFITVLSLASLVGILSAIVMYSPRILFAMGRDGLMPRGVLNVNKGGTPANALIAFIVVTIAFAATGSFEVLLAVAAFLGLATDSLVYLSVFVLRRRDPGAERPYRAVGYPVLPGIVLAGAWILLIVYVAGNTMSSLYSIGILLLLYPAFRLIRNLSQSSV